jgi:hypothetical protein
MSQEQVLIALNEVSAERSERDPFTYSVISEVDASGVVASRKYWRLIDNSSTLETVFHGNNLTRLRYDGQETEKLVIWRTGNEVELMDSLSPENEEVVNANQMSNGGVF